MSLVMTHWYLIEYMPEHRCWNLLGPYGTRDNRRTAGIEMKCEGRFVTELDAPGPCSIASFIPTEKW